MTSDIDDGGQREVLAPRPAAERDPRYNAEGMKGLAAKLAKAYGLISGVAKEGKNATQNYKFATSESIFRGCRDAMHQVGLALVPQMLESIEEPIYKDGGKERRGCHLQQEFEMLLIDTETGFALPSRWLSEVIEFGDKAFSKVATAAAKYFLRTLFLIPTDEDPDAESPDGRAATSSKARAATNGAAAKKEDPAATERRALVAELGLSAQQCELIKGIAQGNSLQLLRDAKSEGCKDAAQVMAYLFDGVHPSDQAAPAGESVSVFDQLEPVEKLVAFLPDKVDRDAFKTACETSKVSWTKIVASMAEGAKKGDLYAAIGRLADEAEEERKGKSQEPEAASGEWSTKQSADFKIACKKANLDPADAMNGASADGCTTFSEVMGWLQSRKVAS